MADIFISYVQDDRHCAASLAGILESKGWSVWWDRQLVPGDVFDETIQTEVERSACVIVLWSASSVRSRWVRAEAEVGANRGVLVPAIIEAAISIPIAFRSIQAADLSAWRSSKVSDSALAGLLGAVAGLVRPVVSPNPLPSDQSQSLGWKRRGIQFFIAFALVLIAIGTVTWFRASRPQDSSLLFALATSEYYAKDYVAAGRRLQLIASDPAYSRMDRQLALEFLASLFVEAAMLDSAKVAISQLLDLEPPLITLARHEYQTPIGALYDEVRRDRIARSAPPRERATVKAVGVLPFQQLGGSADYLSLQGGLENLLVGDLFELGVRVVERGGALEDLLREQELSLSVSDTLPLTAADLQQFYAWSGLDGRLPTGPRSFVNLTDLENLLQTRGTEPASHYLLGSYSIVEDSLGQLGRISATVWMYDPERGKIVAWAVESARVDSILSLIPSLATQLRDMFSVTR